MPYPLQSQYFSNSNQLFQARNIVAPHLYLSITLYLIASPGFFYLLYIFKIYSLISVYITYTLFHTTWNFLLDY